MKANARRRRAWAACLCFGLGLAACGDRSAAPAGAAVEPAYGGTVVVAGPVDLDALNSLVTQERYTQELVRYALFVPLVAYDSALGYAPALATSWLMTGDTGVVFQLRDDVHWHDGVRTTAWDVAFTFERAKDPATAFPQTDVFQHWTGVEVLDSFRVRFTFEVHSDPLAGLPFVPVMPRHALEAVAPEQMRAAAFNRQPVGNGPFRFVEYRPNDRWVFEANPEFPEGLGGRPYVDRLIWRVIPDNTAQVTELRTGNADLVLNVRPEQYPGLDSVAGLRGIERPARQYAFVAWNGRRAPFGDARVRRAMTLAMDRQRVIDGLRDGRGSIALGPVGEWHWGYAADLAQLPFDRDSARALLLAAGITDRDGDGTLDRADGQPFEFDLLVVANNAFNRDVAELIVSDLTAIGVRATLRTAEAGALVAAITAPARDFDAVLFGWESDFRVNVRDLFHSAALDGPFQIAGYANPEVDTLIDRIARTVDRAEAQPLLHRLQEILRDDQPWTFLYAWPDLYVARERLQGVHMDIRGAFVTLPRWWVTDAPRAGQ